MSAPDPKAVALGKALLEKLKKAQQQAPQPKKVDDLIKEAKALKGDKDID